MARPQRGRQDLQPLEENLAARSGRDRRQLRRQREAHVFADQVEIALIRESEFREAIADLLDQNFGS